MIPIFKKPKSLREIQLHYCPGCSHGIIHRLVAEVLDEFDIQGTTIGVSPVGCSYNNYEYFDIDMIQAPHGRAPAVATGLKRSLPENIVFTYQGDGDLAAIGTAEIVHAAARGENITVIFVNNAVYGMTSGQMAPTTLINQVTTTTPLGRDPILHGYPLRVCEMIATLDGATFVSRTSTHDVKNVRETKKAIKKAFQIQIAKKGFSMVEVLSTCPTNWGLSPIESQERLKNEMASFYPIGVYKGKDLEG
jgi:2-oxoglutarate/2-oxoacid ferredoxin oxidoreductase subunit beta